jgi:hypothetical protein
MKNLFLFLSLAFTAVYAEAHITIDKEPKKMKAQKVRKHGKEHLCTAACTNGQHVYAHKEKEHVCTEKCQENVS